MKKLFLVLLLVMPAGKALADLCTARPTLSSPTVCNVPTTGGICSFGNADGIVDFPDGQAVTGAVYISGGNNVWIGGDNDAGGQIGGRIVLDADSDNEAISFSNTNAGTKYIEGISIDVNGNCDAFALRNHLHVDVTYTFVANYVTGTFYGTCHGDIIQNQTISPGGTYTENIVIEHLAADTESQGIFVPDRNDGTHTLTMSNVYLRTQSTYPQLWISGTNYDDPYYQTDLTDVYSENNTNCTHVVPDDPSEYTCAGGKMTFSQSSPDTMIEDGSGGAGFVNNGTVPSDVDLTFPGNTGLNYNRAYFCADASPAANYISKEEFQSWCRGLGGFNVARCEIQ